MSICITWDECRVLMPSESNFMDVCFDVDNLVIPK